MSTLNNKNIVIGIAISFFGLFFNSLFAQTLFFQNPQTDHSQISVRYLRPNFDQDYHLSTLTGVYDLSVQIPLSSRMNIIANLPFIAFSRKGEETENGIGNIFIGICGHPIASNKYSHLSFGLFLPTISEDKFSIFWLGSYSNLYELYKYYPNTLILVGRIAYNYRHQSQGEILGFEIGPSIYIPTKDEYNERDTEVIGHYGLKAGYQFSMLAIVAELLGSAIITEEDIDASDRFVHSLAFGAQWTRNRIKPGIFYQIYLKEEMRESIDGVLGVKIDIVLH